MSHRKRRKIWGLVGILITTLIAYSPPFQDFVSMPNKMRLFPGSVEELSLSIPTTAVVTTDKPGVISINGNEQKNVQVDMKKPVTIRPNKEGEAELTIKVGNIPIKTVQVSVLEDIKLYPGGQSVGVKLHSAGILVVGHKLVEGEDGVKVSPAEKADIRVGDLILRINNRQITEASRLGDLVNEAGRTKKPLKVEILRGKDKIQLNLDPVQDKEDRQYKLGLYVRDSAAGVGTMTFVDPKTKKYGALGHVISDMDTQKPIIVGKGSIVSSKVTHVDRGEQGKPGSIRAIFSDEDKPLGNIDKNTQFGIYGKLDRHIEHPMYQEPLPIALVEQVKEGPAEILTVVEGNKIERFSIEIVNVIKQRYPSTKGMIIRITDPRLIAKTGGIVQGMSGSPIIQDGRLVGAVTHVFVNDPTQGYGLFIEWMIDEAGIPLRSTQQNKIKAA